MRVRNRRIGEFLKELDFTEGRGTGIPKIIRAMRQNGSPPAEFEFDEDHSYFMTRLPVHRAALEVTESGMNGMAAAEKSGPTLQGTLRATLQATPQVEELLETLSGGGELSRAEIMERLGLRDRVNFNNSYLRPALDAELVEMTIPETPRHMHQKYRLTAKGAGW